MRADADEEKVTVVRVFVAGGTGVPAGDRAVVVMTGGRGFADAERALGRRPRRPSWRKGFGEEA
ncbi:hypothetical protein [Streptomyces sp. NPDC048338]|uniref:hypothetical protein n=1 Tax=Streptomyces sp. NPDC048338 TaxID=3365536 RepID=UPI003718F7B1